jgi:periplasmic nitrate reductase NapD
MNLSGILVVAQPEWQAQVVEGLQALEGVEVHQVEAETGRIVVVQEAEDINAEMAALRRIKALPHVIMAEMVYHYVAEDERSYEMPPELQEKDEGFEGGIDRVGFSANPARQAVPAALNS